MKTFQLDRIIEKNPVIQGMREENVDAEWATQNLNRMESSMLNDQSLVQFKKIPIAMLELKLAKKRTQLMRELRTEKRQREKTQEKRVKERLKMSTKNANETRFTDLVHKHKQASE
eukprot:CAMPEP_0117428784 /NCGR_PEP_ID=MMETSP0758-20121206/8417_1 /TAXON_ID=63605 /ORGANISM="Percolomonas cosmopolitus, Strain AE-1 (ATCC 50343)" /LENGTH=115 /DNA_ID=CAMNT_0005215337 /DNA_START=137 /DNA_END=481 /DNA_ORIENTATION=+